MRTRFAFWAIYALLWVYAFAASGCTLVPAPWTVDRGAGVEKAEARAATARETVLHRAQAETAVAEIALRTAPPSLPVEIAREATTAAVSLQAQALGPLAEAGRQRAEKLVAELQSSAPEIREAAKRLRAEDAESAAEDSAALAAANARTEQAEKKLADAYQRERALASLVRKVVWACIGLGVLAVVGAALSVYLKVASGGATSALSAVVSGLERFKVSTPSARSALEESLRGVMDTAHKLAVRKAKVTAAP